MDKTILDSVICTAKSVIIAEIGLLLGVQQELCFIKDELEMMQAFLRAATATEEQGRSEVVTTWIKQVRELAFDVEDCLAEFAVEVGKKRRCRSLRMLTAQRRLATQLRDIKARVENVSQRNLRYGLIKATSDDAAAIDLEQLASESATPVEEEEQLVGLAVPEADLIKWISENNQALSVIPVVGMSGVGKTTLVKKVYDNPEVSNVFHCRAWVSLSDRFDKKEFIRSLDRQIPRDSPEGSGENKVKKFKQKVTTEGKKLKDLEKVLKEIKEYLQNKRCMIVLDGLVRTSDWDKIRLFFPDTHKGSRIIVTTQNTEVANYLRSQPQYHCHLQPLSVEESLVLFYRKVYKKSDYEEPPEDLQTEANVIVERCSGVPRTIAILGNYLATRHKTSAEWKKVKDHYASVLQNDPIFQETTVGLANLPYDIKPCFLYMGCFPSDFEIRQSRLIRRWMAEGYLRERRDMTAEEVGESYFHDLISRNKMHASESSTAVNGRVNCCQIHNTEHLIVSNLMQENLVVLDERRTAVPQEKVRHLVIASAWNRKEKLPKNMNLSHVRSLTIFGEYKPSFISHKMKLLRVLDLENTFRLKNRDLNKLKKLCHLKYLSLRGTDISQIPRSLEKLQDLETLDIRNTYVTTLPKGIIKLQKLRYLRAGLFIPFDENISRETLHDYRIIGILLLILMNSIKRDPFYSALLFAVFFCVDLFGVKVPKGIGKLKALHTLGVIDTGRSSTNVLRELKELNQLKKLGLAGMTKKNGKELGDVLGELSDLQSLFLRSHDKQGFDGCLDSLASPPKHLQSLKIYGILKTLPSWVSSLTNLIKVYLRTSQLEDDALEVLQNLPNLAVLRLYAKSLVVKEVSFHGQTFVSLEILELQGLEQLESVSFEENTMPKLRELTVDGCYTLTNDGISGIGFLKSLKEISLYDMDGKEELVSMVQNQVDEHPNHPNLLWYES